MDIKIESKLGDVRVDTAVIAGIAGSIASKCYGVVGMAARNKRDGLVNLLKPDYMAKGITVDALDGGMVIELHVMLEYGVNISVVCNSIVNNVKYKIEQMTGLQVNKINVNVEGIRVDE